MPKPNNSKPSKQQDPNRQCFAASIMPETLNRENRTVDVVFFTSIDVPRYDYWKGEPYILRFKPEGADLSLLNSGAPVFDNHDTWGGASDSQKGVVDKGWREGKEFKATLRYSKRKEVDGLWGDIEDKIVQKFSMGVELLEKKELVQEAGKLRVVEVTKWRPFEISTAPIPADFGTRTLSGDGDEELGADEAAALALRQREIEIARLKA